MSNEEDYIKKWLSAHIYFNGNIYSYKCDEVIIKVIEPFVKICLSNKWIDKYFFIRYVEYGHHVRLRFLGNEDILNNQVKPTFEEYLQSIPLELAANPIGLDFANITPSRIKNLLWSHYEPEIKRYGGKHLISTAEKMFYYSSEICFILLKKIGNGNSSQRLGKGLILMLLALKTFYNYAGTASAFIKGYSDAYLRTQVTDKNDFTLWQSVYNNCYEMQSKQLNECVTDVWEVMDQEGDLGYPFDKYWERLIEVKAELKILFNKGLIFSDDDIVRDWITTSSLLLSSYIHMTNNRLGISIPEESYIAFLIQSTINKPALKL
jgi:thiopeptide-type bacteriocin biosynthesis protein